MVVILRPSFLAITARHAAIVAPVVALPVLAVSASLYEAYRHISTQPDVFLAPGLRGERSTDKYHAADGIVQRKAWWTHRTAHPGEIF